MDDTRFKKAFDKWITSPEGIDCRCELKPNEYERYIKRLALAFMAGWTAGLENAEEIINNE